MRVTGARFERRRTFSIETFVRLDNASDQLVSNDVVRGESHEGDIFNAIEDLLDNA
jgi:hypothetical protein